jgi:hypothetical protein
MAGPSSIVAVDDRSKRIGVRLLVLIIEGLEHGLVGVILFVFIL